MKPHVDRHVRVFLDAVPRPGSDPTAWRTEQICKGFANSDAETNLVLYGPSDGPKNIGELSVVSRSLNPPLVLGCREQGPTGRGINRIDSLTQNKTLSDLPDVENKRGI